METPAFIEIAAEALVRAHAVLREYDDIENKLATLDVKLSMHQKNSGEEFHKNAIDSHLEDRHYWKTNQTALLEVSHDWFRLDIAELRSLVMELSMVLDMHETLFKAHLNLLRTFEILTAANVFDIDPEETETKDQYEYEINLNEVKLELIEKHIRALLPFIDFKVEAKPQ